MEVKAVAPWYGSNRMLAKQVGLELAGCEFVGVPFAGGMSELAEKKARTIDVNDKHHHAINLARVIGDPMMGPKLYRAVRRLPFHPGVLANSQSICRHYDSHPNALPASDPIDEANLAWAVSYFVCAWMPRHATSGTKGEFNVGISTRWSATGGDSAAHYQGAIRSMNSFRRILRRCNFTVLDFREFLKKCKDLIGHGIYSDAPFLGPGDKYKHRFTIDDHRDLAKFHASYKQARVVIRYYDVPLIRELYPEPLWTWRLLAGRKQTNDAAPEVLILNGPSYA